MVEGKKSRVPFNIDGFVLIDGNVWHKNKIITLNMVLIK